jgi:ankyrin repeat protein
LINRVDINTTDELNNTPLHIATQNDDYDIVKLLVEHGADVNAENILGETPYFLAGTNEIIREYLRENGAYPYTQPSYSNQNTASVLTLNTTNTNVSNPKNIIMNINTMINNNPRQINGGRRKTRKRRSRRSRRNF